MTLNEEQKVEDKVLKVLEDVKPQHLVFNIKKTFKLIKTQSSSYDWAGSFADVKWFLK